jgi:hypothetical protein
MIQELYIRLSEAVAIDGANMSTAELELDV